MSLLLWQGIAIYSLGTQWWKKWSSFHSWFHLVDCTVNSQELAERDGSEQSHNQGWPCIIILIWSFELIEFAFMSFSIKNYIDTKDTKLFMNKFRNEMGNYINKAIRPCTRIVPKSFIA